MTLVFAGICSHGPGLTGRADLADFKQLAAMRDAFAEMRQRLDAARPDALIVVAAEHFANFFMDNMPSFAMGMAEYYDGPIEDPSWLGIEPVRVPGVKELSRRLIVEVMQEIDLSYAEEWKLDHGILVPLHFLTPDHQIPIVPVNINCQGPPLPPLHRCWIFGEALRRAVDVLPERIAMIATGGISHWPATPDSGKINENWDRAILDCVFRHDREALLAYRDADVYREAGQGGFEMRTYVALSAATQGAEADLLLYEPIPIFAVGVTVATMRVE
tara:strand:+ start:8927 stop:9748 length:822 start_codon:yes stop_codon:yes gene_type:complete